MSTEKINDHRAVGMAIYNVAVSLLDTGVGPGNGPRHGEGDRTEEIACIGVIKH